MSVARPVDAVVGELCGDLSTIRAPRGVEFLAPLEPGHGVRATHAFVRSLSTRLGDDRPLAPDIEAVAEAIGDGSLLAAVEAEVGELQ